MDANTPRLRQGAWALVRQTMGGPRDIREKVLRLGQALRGYGSQRRVAPRLQRLRELGYVEDIPTRVQRVVGAIDMMRFFIVPCADDYYVSRGITFRFHTVLRFLDDPASVVDPTGFNSARDTIIGHVMQVVHANPVYDFQLLETFEDGMEEMERQVEAVLDGTHPRARSIRATVEDANYHDRLLEYVRAYRAGRNVRRFVRENIDRTPRFRLAEKTFGTMPAAMRYFSSLPKRPLAALRHVLTVRELRPSR